MIQVSTSAQIGHSQSRIKPTAASITSVARPAALPLSASNFERDSINTNSQIISPLLSRKEAAKYLGMAEQTLAQWTCSGRNNLPLIKIGRSVKYRKADVDAFIQARVQLNCVANAKECTQ